MENFKKFIEDHKLLDAHIRETIARFNKDFPKEYARVDLWTVSNDKITIAYSWGLEGMDIAYREFPMEFFTNYESAAEKKKKELELRVAKLKTEIEVTEKERDIREYQRLKAKFES
jgi:hypothetical protein